MGHSRRMELQVAGGAQGRSASTYSRRRTSLARTSRSGAPLSAGSVGAAWQKYIRTTMDGAGPLSAPENLVAGVVSHSGYVGRCCARHDVVRDDVSLARGNREETWTRRRPQDAEILARVLDDHARHEGRAHGRPVVRRAQSCTGAPVV